MKSLTSTISIFLVLSLFFGVSLGQYNNGGGLGDLGLGGLGDLGFNNQQQQPVNNGAGGINLQQITQLLQQNPGILNALAQLLTGGGGGGYGGGPFGGGFNQGFAPGGGYGPMGYGNLGNGQGLGGNGFGYGVNPVQNLLGAGGNGYGGQRNGGINFDDDRRKRKR